MYQYPPSASSSSYPSPSSNVSPYPRRGPPQPTYCPPVSWLFQPMISPSRQPSATVALSFEEQLRKMIGLGPTDLLSFDGLHYHWVKRKTANLRRTQKNNAAASDSEEHKIKQLIAVALYDSRWQRLKLREIIQRIMDAYPATYGPGGTKGEKWKETIRNKLSYYGMFVRCEPLPGQKEDKKPVDKHGGYWGLDPYDETTSRSRRLAAKAGSSKSPMALQEAGSLTANPQTRPAPSKKAGAKTRKKVHQQRLSPLSIPLAIPYPRFGERLPGSKNSISHLVSTPLDELYYNVSPEGYWSPEIMELTYDSQAELYVHPASELADPNNLLTPEPLFEPEGCDFDIGFKYIDWGDPSAEEPREPSYGRQLRTRVTSRKLNSPY